ncbi:MAG: 6-pyruvoyl trahydropterin synthase family protein [Planctomycetota bacterium]
MGSHAVRVALTFSYGHRVPGHEGRCVHLHGHNARVEVECRGDLDALGMVVDFAEIRRVLHEWIDAHWDHRMILQRGDPLGPVLLERDEPVYELEAPPTAENMAAHLYRVAEQAGLPVSVVRFWESDTAMAVFEGE